MHFEKILLALAMVASVSAMPTSGAKEAAGAVAESSQASPPPDKQNHHEIVCYACRQIYVFSHLVNYQCSITDDLFAF